ncbi:MAG: aldose 1-epimerase family protein [Candidatus Gallimonas sp.]
MSSVKGKISNPEQLCSVREARFSGGREDGERVLLVENGRLSFTVLADRALDIYDLRYRGENISFLSKNGLCGFRGDFDSVFPGGFLYTCGLDRVGGGALPVHGKLHNLPARISSVRCDGRGISIGGTVRQSALFGGNLVMNRTISCEYASGKLTVVSEIVNEGAREDGYCLLFHMNLGYPFLDEGASVETPVRATEPRTERAARNRKDCFVLSAPKEEEEQVFYHTLDRGEVRVTDGQRRRRITFSYDERALPYLIEWKSMVAGDYALGIEPSTTRLDGYMRQTKIAPGEVHRYEISVSIEDL